jgi:hypothetical protein
MPAPARTINLLPPSEFEASFWGKFLQWAVSTGRYIIILTELVVILAFLSRFKLDNDIANLNEQIEGKKSVLIAHQPVENEFRNVQDRLNAAGKIMDGQLKAGVLLDQITSETPGEVKITDLNLSQTGIIVTANANNEKALGEFLARLNMDDQWKGIDMTSVSADSTKGIKFSLVLTK